MHKICMIGTFPPPMHGMAAVNLAMRDYLVANGETPAIFDLSASRLSRSLRVRFTRAIRVMRQLGVFCKFLRSNPNVTVYISVSGGYGQLFEMSFVLLARFWNARILLHHHNFLYIEHARLLTKMLVFCSGIEAYHIALCNSMAKKLKSSYPLIRRVEVMSNSALISINSSDARIRKSMRTVGYLGNIEADKGILEFLDILLLLQANGDDIAAIIAGPFFNAEIEKFVRGKISALGNVQYVGSKYGADKIEFFNSIDVLLYPTRNDAEPLTVLESLSYGVPVLARSRGCLDEMVSADAGAVIDFEQDYVAAALNQLRLWRDCPDVFTEKSRGAADRYRQMQSKSAESLKNILSIMTAV
jgi:glycosyltransferase involved in cell wall biosynthesis